MPSLPKLASEQIMDPSYFSLSPMCVHVCACVSMCACVHACVCVCMCVGGGGKSITMEPLYEVQFGTIPIAKV